MPKEPETTDLDSNIDCKGAYPNLAYGGKLAFVSVCDKFADKSLLLYKL